jgi:DNA/RNA-binding domain of Phe-tRNA-synthetase-like protein
MVTTATRDALVIVYAPAEIPKAQMERVINTTAQRIAQIAGGQEIARAVS